MHVQLNGGPHALDGAATVAELLMQLELDPRLVAVEVNQTLIPRDRHADHQLGEGDCVEVVTFVGGG